MNKAPSNPPESQMTADEITTLSRFIDKTNNLVGDNPDGLDGYALRSAVHTEIDQSGLPDETRRALKKAINRQTQTLVVKVADLLIKPEQFVPAEEPEVDDADELVEEEVTLEEEAELEVESRPETPAKRMPPPAPAPTPPEGVEAVSPGGVNAGAETPTETGVEDLEGPTEPGAEPVIPAKPDPAEGPTEPVATLDQIPGVGEDLAATLDQITAPQESLTEPQARPLQAPRIPTIGDPALQETRPAVGAAELAALRGGIVAPEQGAAKRAVEITAVTGGPEPATVESLDADADVEIDIDIDIEEDTGFDREQTAVGSLEGLYEETEHKFGEMTLVKRAVQVPVEDGERTEHVYAFKMPNGQLATKQFKRPNGTIALLTWFDEMQKSGRDDVLLVRFAEADADLTMNQVKARLSERFEKISQANIEAWRGGGKLGRDSLSGTARQVMMRDYPEIALYGTYNFLRSDGEFLINETIEHATPFRDGMAILRSGDLFYYFEESGELLATTGFAKTKTPQVSGFDEAHPFVGGFARVARYARNIEDYTVPYANSILNSHGVEYSTTQEGELDEFDETMNGNLENRARREQDERSGYEKSYYFIDRQGKRMRIAAGVVEARDFSESRAAVRLRGRGSCDWAFIDENGQPLTKETFMEVSDFQSGIAWVRRRNQKWNVLKQDGTMLSEQDYARIWEVDEHMLMVLRGHSYEVGEEGKSVRKSYLGLLSTETGELLQEEKFIAIRPYFGGRAAVQRVNNKWSYLKSNGEFLTTTTKLGGFVDEAPVEFDEAGDFGEDGFADVCFQGQWFRINLSGQPVELVDETPVDEAVESIEMEDVPATELGGLPIGTAVEAESLMGGDQGEVEKPLNGGGQAAKSNIHVIPGQPRTEKRPGSEGPKAPAALVDAFDPDPAGPVPTDSEIRRTPMGENWGVEALRPSVPPAPAAPEVDADEEPTVQAFPQAETPTMQIEGRGKARSIESVPPGAINLTAEEAEAALVIVEGEGIPEVDQNDNERAAATSEVRSRLDEVTQRASKVSGAFGEES